MKEQTKYEALIGEVAPYTPSPLTLQKALMDANAGDPDDVYRAAVDKPVIAMAAIDVLLKLKDLASDSMGKSSQSYRDKMDERIARICKQNGFDVSDFVKIPTITDGSNLW